MITIYQQHSDIGYKSWAFPGKELGFQIIGDVKPSEAVIIGVEYPSTDDLALVLQAADALKRMGMDKSNVTLDCPYLPYARQDRACSPGEAFSLEVFISYLATAHIGHICVADVHSQVGLDLLKAKFETVTHVEQWACAMDLPKYDVLIAPDKGASEKVRLHAQVTNQGTDVVILSKTRQEGKVIYDQLAPGTLKGRLCVVDDICDGGATFEALGEMVRATQQDVEVLDLYVTHGIFSKGLEKLSCLYDQIYTHNLMNTELDSQVRVI
ncbi:MAG TPA: ribose-phosphate pyrophosphokinase-like domain-containing protein [Methanosarcina sp.]|nr:ribose-phosphate pyrophosphokinase-like domain-containing protein [Methanosarcina sp.]